MNYSAHIAFVLLLICSPCDAQYFTDTVMLNRIEQEAFQNSNVSSTMSMLVDKYSPRLTGSDMYLNGVDWIKNQLNEWSCDSVWTEPFDFPHPGWEVENYELEMISPRYKQIITIPAAWSGSTEGPIEATPVVVDFMHLDSMRAWVGRLEGEILIYPHSEERLDILFPEISSEEIAEYENHTFENDDDRFLPEQLVEELYSDDLSDPRLKSVIEFLHREKVRGIIMPSIYDNNIVKVGMNDFYQLSEFTPVPWMYITKEAHGQIIRLTEGGHTPILRYDSQTRFYNRPENNQNIFAEIKGVDPDLSHEVVMAGAHFDTWHGSDGAADNSSGVVVVMEALRILKALNVPPKRTIQIGMWGGEEQRFYGSRDFAKKHLIDSTRIINQEGENKYTAYYNIDSGGGKIRGLFTQGNDIAAQMIKPQMASFAKWNGDMVSIDMSSGSDHMIFDIAGVPTFDYLQDPLRYWSHQHHTNLDVYELIPEENLKTNAVIIAYNLYCAAMQEQSFPSKPKLKTINNK